jgi:hypothetical protein
MRQKNAPKDVKFEAGEWIDGAAWY